MTNADRVNAIYAAFGRGDVPGILEHLADDVEWEYGPAVPDVPWLQPRRGRAEMPAFFAALQGLDLQVFQPTAIVSGDRVVVALINVEGTVRATGKRVVEPDEVHIWHFDGGGKVVRFRHRADTYQQWAACRP